MSNKGNWIRVSEYARNENISVAAAWKRINKVGSTLQTKKEYNLTLVKVK